MIIDFSSFPSFRFVSLRHLAGSFGCKVKSSLFISCLTVLILPSLNASAQPLRSKSGDTQLQKVLNQMSSMESELAKLRKQVHHIQQNKGSSLIATEQLSNQPSDFSEHQRIMLPTSEVSEQRLSVPSIDQEARIDQAKVRAQLADSGALVVIVNEQSPFQSIDVKTLRKIYRLKQKWDSDGNMLAPLIPATDSRSLKFVLKEVFNVDREVRIKEYYFSKLANHKISHIPAKVTSASDAVIEIRSDVGGLCVVDPNKLRTTSGIRILPIKS